jgi:cytosine/adenosine deaminase-related metal-dependent hydrolase
VHENPLAALPCGNHGRRPLLAIEDAAIVTSAGLIEWIGPRAELAPVEADRTVDLGGAWVTPG